MREYTVNWLVVRVILESEVWFGKVMVLCSRVNWYNGKLPRKRDQIRGGGWGTVLLYSQSRLTTETWINSVLLCYEVSGRLNSTKSPWWVEVKWFYLSRSSLLWSVPIVFDCVFVARVISVTSKRWTRSSIRAWHGWWRMISVELWICRSLLVRRFLGR